MKKTRDYLIGSVIALTFIYGVVPIFVYIVSIHNPIREVDQSSIALCKDISEQMRSDYKNTKFEENNFYRSCLLEMECVIVDESCPVDEIKNLSKDWVSKK